MRNHNETFVAAFKGTAAAVGIALKAGEPKALIEELEERMPNETGMLDVIAEYARNSSSLTVAYHRSKIWGDTFADRASAALGIMSFSRTVIAEHAPSNSRRHHWAPLCFSSRFQSVRPRSRKFAVPAYDYASGVSKSLPQSEMILPFTKKAGYNTSALEELYCTLETGYARAYTEALDQEESRFYLGVFTLAQALRMNTPESKPPSNVGDFIEEFLASLDSTLTPTIHRMNHPVGFSASTYFRKLVTANGVAYVAPAARKIAVVFSASDTTSSIRKSAALHLRSRQRAGSLITKTRTFGIDEDFKNSH